MRLRGAALAVVASRARHALLERVAAFACEAIRVAMADTVTVVVRCALTVGAGAAHKAILPPRAVATPQLAEWTRQIGAGVARVAVVCLGALALLVKALATHDVAARTWLRRWQPTGAPRAIGTASARTERLIVVFARIAGGRDRVDRSLVTRVGGTAREARRRTRRILVRAPRALVALVAARSVGESALAAWPRLQRGRTAGAPAARRTRLTVVDRSVVEGAWRTRHWDC